MVSRRRFRTHDDRRSGSRLSIEPLESRAMMAAYGSNQGSNYAQLHRDIVIRADVYGGSSSQPRILAAGYGFEGITGIPGLLTENQLSLAVAAGAGGASGPDEAGRTPERTSLPQVQPCPDNDRVDSPVASSVKFCRMK